MKYFGVFLKNTVCFLKMNVFYPFLDRSVTHKNKTEKYS